MAFGSCGRRSTWWQEALVITSVTAYHTAQAA